MLTYSFLQATVWTPTSNVIPRVPRIPSRTQVTQSRGSYLRKELIIKDFIKSKCKCFIQQHKAWVIYRLVFRLLCSFSGFCDVATTVAMTFRTLRLIPINLRFFFFFFLSKELPSMSSLSKYEITLLGKLIYWVNNDV